MPPVRITEEVYEAFCDKYCQPNWRNFSKETKRKFREMIMPALADALEVYVDSIRPEKLRR